MIHILRDSDHTIVKELFRSIFTLSEDLFFRIAWKKRTKERSFGLWIEEKLIGIAIICNTKLEYICIDPDYQGKGWGSILLQHVLSVCPTLYLNPADDLELCKWYEKQGFQLSKEVKCTQWTERCYVHHTYATRSKTARKI